MATEEMSHRRPRRRGRGAVWASIVVVGVAGAAAGVVAYVRPDLNPLAAPATPAPNAPATSGSASAGAKIGSASAPATVGSARTEPATEGSAPAIPTMAVTAA